jgi:hypothetical protein
LRERERERERERNPRNWGIFGGFDLIDMVSGHKHGNEIEIGEWTKCR